MMSHEVGVGDACRTHNLEPAWDQCDGQILCHVTITTTIAFEQFEPLEGRPMLWPYRPSSPSPFV